MHAKSPTDGVTPPGAMRLQIPALQPVVQTTSQPPQFLSSVLVSMLQPSAGLPLQFAFGAVHEIAASGPPLPVSAPVPPSPPPGPPPSPVPFPVPCGSGAKRGDAA